MNQTTIDRHSHPHFGGDMAVDVYLFIDGIKGESADSAHQGWIEVTAAQWGVKQPKSATSSTAGGHTAERCEHRSLTISKLADLSSPLLLQTCSAGRTISKAKLECMRADGQGERVKYYEVELENVLIGSMDQVVHEGDILHDSIGLKFSKVHWNTPSRRLAAVQEAIPPAVGTWQLTVFADGSSHARSPT